VACAASSAAPRAPGPDFGRPPGGSEELGKWIEVGNSGMFRPEMLRPMGLPEGVNVIAWGLSLERRAPARRPNRRGGPRLPCATRPADTASATRRPTMILYGIDNIRDLFGHKVRALRLRSCRQSGRAGLRARRTSAALG
jgi:hypothetical protein